MSVSVGTVLSEGSTTATASARQSVGGRFDAKTLSDSFHVFADAEGGVAGLRAWVLELAIRGCLLGGSKEGAGSNPHAFGQVPASWSISPLGDVADIIRGITFPASAKRREPTLGHVACLRTSNVQRSLEWGDLLYVPATFVRNPDQWVREGDLCISMANSYELVGKVAPVVGARPTTTFGGFLAVIRPRGDLLAPYLALFMTSPTVQKELRKGATQTTNIANISLGRLRPLLVWIPTLAEQERIVARVDQLMALIDDLEAKQKKKEEVSARFTKASLEALTAVEGPEEFDAARKRVVENFPTLIDRAAKVQQIRKSILKLAVRGRLVGQRGDEEPGTVLLARMAAGPLPKHSSSLPALPASWVYTSLGHVAVVKSGTTLDPALERDSGAWPYLKISDMNLQGNEREITTSSRFVNESEALERFLIGPRSIIFPKRGGAIATNKKRMVRRPILVDLNTMAITCPGEMSFEYVYLWFLTIDLAELDNGTSVPQINHKDILPLPLPLPPRAEQDRIVARVGDLMNLCDELEDKLRRAEARASKLVEAVAREIVA